MRLAIVAVVVFLGGLAGIAACGGPPALQNAPRPNPAAVAGAAAAVAGAAMLADPDAAARRANAEKERDHVDAARGVEVRQTVPADVLDRLDAAKAPRDAGADAEPEPDAP